MYFGAVMLAISGTLLYHLSMKFVPNTVNPFFSLAISYGMAMLLCLPGIYYYSGTRSLYSVDWSVAGVAVGIFGIELGFLLLYRAGGNLGISSLLTNAANTLILLPIGWYFFRESFSALRLFGLLLTLAGLWLLMLRK